MPVTMSGISSSIGLAGEAGAEHGAGGTRLAIAFERDAGERAGDEREVVERRPGSRPKRTEPADAIARQLGLDLDVFDHRGGKGARGFARRWIAADRLDGCRPSIEAQARRGRAQRCLLVRSKRVILGSRQR